MDAQRHEHGAAEPGPAAGREEPVAAAVLVAEDGVAGPVPGAVFLIVSAGEVGAQLIGERTWRREGGEVAVVSLPARVMALSPSS